MTLKKVGFIITIFLFAIIGAIFFILYSFMEVDLSELNGSGELQESFISPTGRYQADLYLINKGGATVGFQHRVSITSLSDEEKEFKDETIYWMYPADDSIDISWKDNDEINIDNEIINIKEPKTYFNYKENK